MHLIKQHIFLYLFGKEDLAHSINKNHFQIKDTFNKDEITPIRQVILEFIVNFLRL